MKFPVVIKHRTERATIYGRSEKYPYYRVAYRAAGKRVIRSFATYGEALAEANAKVREISQGNQSVALSAKEATDALAIRDILAGHRQKTGHRFTALQAVTGFLDALEHLPAGHNLTEAVRSFRGSVAVVQRTPLADAVAEFCAARQAKTVAAPDKRPALNPVYVADTTRHLQAFAAAFPGTAVSELKKSHLDAYLGSHMQVSAKTRNHLRATLRMFLAWCIRHDYLAAHHRLLEADAMAREPLDTAPIQHYRPEELRALLEASSGPMRAAIALQALGGLRLVEVLRLHWREVFDIPGHIEASSAKSKTRQRRLVEICPALEQWLAPYRGMDGKVTTQDLDAHSHSLTLLVRALKIQARFNGLRRGFITYHYALHANENYTAAQAGTSATIIHSNYKGLATKAEAEKWFNIRPAGAAENVVPLPKQAGA